MDKDRKPDLHNQDEILACTQVRVETYIFSFFLVCKGGETLQATCSVKVLTVWRSSRPTCTSCGHLFSCPLVPSFPSEEVGTFKEVANAERGKSGARGNCGQPWVQQQAVGRNPERKKKKAAKTERVHLFFDLPFGESKRIRPSNMEDPCKANILEDWREPIYCPSLGSCFSSCQHWQRSNWSLLLPQGQNVPLKGKTCFLAFFQDQVRNASLTRASKWDQSLLLDSHWCQVAACREHRLSGSSLNPSVQEALTIPNPGALVAKQAFVGWLEDMSLKFSGSTREVL